MPVNSVCVFAGSGSGRNEGYADAARELARELVARDYTLIYGGGNVGLMGVLAQSVMERGGRVIGVIPEALVLREAADYSITELKVVGSMHERKALMSELSDGVMALPGGLGTLEELFEMLTWAQLGFHARPVGLLNAAGYYNILLGFLDRIVDEGFMRPEHRELLLTDTEAGRLLDAMKDWQSPVPESRLDRNLI